MLLFFRMCTKILFRFFATYRTHRLKINKFRHDRCVMLILIHILVDICPHLVASTAAVHENLRGGLQTLKYCIDDDFKNRPVYDASLLSWSRHTTVSKISQYISCWIKTSESWVLMTNYMQHMQFTMYTPVYSLSNIIIWYMYIMIYPIQQLWITSHCAIKSWGDMLCRVSKWSCSKFPDGKTQHKTPFAAFKLVEDEFRWCARAGESRNLSWVSLISTLYFNQRGISQIYW